MVKTSVWNKKNQNSLGLTKKSFNVHRVKGKRNLGFQRRILVGYLGKFYHR